jgi:hypothetical protein
MFGVSLSNTEHQLAFLQHQYQQLQQACIKNQQQQLEELKAKKIHALLRQKKRILCLTISTCCIISLSLILLEYFNSELSSDADAGALG